MIWVDDSLGRTCSINFSLTSVRIDAEISFSDRRTTKRKKRAGAPIRSLKWLNSLGFPKDGRPPPRGSTGKLEILSPGDRGILRSTFLVNNTPALASTGYSNPLYRGPVRQKTAFHGIDVIG
jgi:hypothetical protein